MKNAARQVAIYARVSTDKQTTDLQLAELREFAKRSGWNIHHEYIDHGYTGANTKRPAFNEMLAEARKKKFDCLLVWKLARLGRSLRDLITTLDELGHLRIDFISYETTSSFRRTRLCPYHNRILERPQDSSTRSSNEVISGTEPEIFCSLTMK